MAVAQPGQDRRARRGGLVAAHQFLAGFEQGEGLGRVDAERFEHFGREDFSNAALEGEAAVGCAAVRGLAGSLGAEVQQPAVLVAKLGEGEAAPVADVGVVHAELVAVIPKGERLRQVLRQRLEPAEMPGPILVRQIEANALRPATVEKARRALREARGLHGVVEGVAEIEDSGIGCVGGHELLKLAKDYRFR